MEFENIKELILLVNSSEITDLEIEEEGFRLRIRKTEKEVVAAPAHLGEQAVVSSPQTPPKQIAFEDKHGLVEVVAPMVGTFYRAPAPDADPFIQVGDIINSGQVLFIIEAMKMMNEIESEVKGVVKEILVENGEPVEYGQPLLLIDPEA